MKKLIIFAIALLVSLSVFGRPRPNPAVIDKHVTDWVIDQLKEMGYTVLPEVIVQDTLNKNKQKFSSRYETKGGRGYRLPEWANDSTWTPGDKPPRGKSNYEKYWEEKNGMVMDKPEPKPEFDDLYYQPSKDAPRVKHQKRSNVDQVVDTIIKYNPDVKVTYEYNYDPFFYSYNLGRFYHGGFNYWMYSNPWYYSNWMYDPYDFYWDMRFSGYPYWNYPYYGGGFYFGYNNFWFGYNSWWHAPYYYHNNYYNHNNYYSHNNYGYNQQPQYGRRDRPSNLSTYQTDNRRVAPQQRNVTTQERRVAPQNRAAYNANRRTYTPSYDNPRMNTRPQYNNSRVGVTTDRRMESTTQSRTQTSTYSRTPNTQRSTQSRTYSAPSRSYNSTPSRSYNSGSSNSYNNSRSSNYSSGSSGFSGSRSSGSSNVSSGSSGSGSSGGRSSGGGLSSGRR